MSYLVKPELRRTTFLATFITPISHHDPAQSNSSNITSFLRRKMTLERANTKPPAPEKVADILRAFPVPMEVYDIFSELTVPEFLAAAAIRQVIRLHNGQGLIDGKERYTRIQTRAEFCAIRANSMFAWWGNMSDALQLQSPYEADAQIGKLIGMPNALAQMVFVELIDNAASAVMLARLWTNATPNDEVPHRPLNLDEIKFNDSSRVTLQVPAFSANSARHEVVREPGALHLLNALDLRYDELPDGVAALLYNGGDLTKSAPSDVFKLTRQIREAYPLIGLIGGSTESFILGAGNLEVSAWLVTTEYQQALDQFGIKADVSAFDLLDQDEHTRHTSKRVPGSPMPFGFETLIAGTQVVVDLRLRPYASELEIGALVAAVDTFFGADGTLGGQSARGYGLSIQDMLVEPSHDMAQMKAAYESYLEANKAVLRAGLMDGTLTTKKSVF